MDQPVSNTPEGDQPDKAGIELDRAMLDLLVCPLTKQSLRYDRENEELISAKARLAYPVRGGIAIMLPSEARVLDE